LGLKFQVSGFKLGRPGLIFFILVSQAGGLVKKSEAGRIA
jgi:hypothetical protein